MPTKSRNRRSPKRLARRMKPTRHLSRRKGSKKKGSARARNPKKMRGGVTRKRLSQLTQQELLTALEELPADVFKQIGKRHPLLIPPFTNKTLGRAIKDYLAVFVHNVLLPSSAGKIIVNGATQSVVGKGRDEQRVPFSNLLDNIGGQLLQSSQQFC